MSTATHLQRLGEQARHRAAVRRAQNILEKVNSEVSSRLEEESRLQSALESIRSRYERALNLVNSERHLENRVQNLQEAFDELSLAGAQKTQEIESLNQEIESMKEDFDKYTNSEMKRLSGVHADYSRKIKLEEERLDGLVKSNGDYSAEVESKKSKVAEMNKTLVETENKISSLFRLMEREKKRADEENRSIALRSDVLQKRTKKLDLYKTRLKSFARKQGIMIPDF